MAVMSACSYRNGALSSNRKRHCHNAGLKGAGDESHKTGGSENKAGLSTA